MSNVPATRIRRTPATLALLLAALGVLVGAAPAEASGSSAMATADCAAASYLIADGHPAEALALVRAVREAEVAASDDPAAKALAAAACSATFVSAVEAICLEARERNDRGEFAEAVTLITGVRDPAIEAVGAGSASSSERRATRACEAELDDATEGVEATTWSDDTGSAWQTFVDDWIAPLQPLGLWIGGVFIGAIVAARLLVLVISRYPRWTPAVMRGMWLGMIPSLLGAALLVLGLSPTDHPPLRNWVLVTLGVVLLLVGTVATAFFFGGRLRLSVVYSGKSEDPAAAAEIISKLVLLGGGRLRGVEIAGAPDIKALDGETFSSVISDTTLKAVFTAVKEIFGSIPWVVTIHEIAGADDGPPDGHVVSVSRNGRSSVSQVVETGRLRFQALGEAGPLGPPWFIASVILVAFARSYRGFGGIDAHSDWRSLGLGVVARELFANKDAEARSLTSLAVRIDARNDVAAYNYMYFSFRHHPDLVGTMRYAAWLRADLDDPGWRVGRQQWSVALMALRKQTNYVSVERNLIALSGVPRPAQPPASAWVVTTSGHLLAAPAVLMALAASPSRRRHPKPGGGRRDEEALACHARLALETNNLILRRLSAPQEDPVLAEMRYRAAVAAWVLHAWSPNTSIAATRVGARGHRGSGAVHQRRRRLLDAVPVGRHGQDHGDLAAAVDRKGRHRLAVHDGCAGDGGGRRPDGPGHRERAGGEAAHRLGFAVHRHRARRQEDDERSRDAAADEAGYRGPRPRRLAGERP